MKHGAGLLLCGTDTGVGKTTVASALLRLARRRQRRLVPFKPAETGCIDGRPADAERLCDAAGLPGLTPFDVCPFRFTQPLAPSIAARLAATTLTKTSICAAGERLAALGDALLVESAGGLLTPYADDFTSADLASIFSIPILLIAANRLGTINHCALALSEIRRRGLPLAGLILVDTTPDAAPDRPHNAAAIAALTGTKPRGTLRHCAGASPDDLADAIVEDVDLAGLTACLP